MPKDRTQLHKSINVLYAGELHAIEQMLDLVEVPNEDDAGEPVPPRLRVRWLIDQYLELKHAAPAEPR